MPRERGRSVSGGDDIRKGPHPSHHHPYGEEGPSPYMYQQAAAHKVVSGQRHERDTIAMEQNFV
jgi:hypothetical protein